MWSVEARCSLAKLQSTAPAGSVCISRMGQRLSQRIGSYKSARRSGSKARPHLRPVQMLGRRQHSCWEANMPSKISQAGSRRAEAEAESKSSANTAATRMDAHLQVRSMAAWGSVQHVREFASERMIMLQSDNQSVTQYRHKGKEGSCKASASCMQGRWETNTAKLRSSWMYVSRVVLRIAV